MINIDVTSGVPIDEQIVNKLSNLILAGALAQKEKIMSVSELSANLTTSFNNVNQAYTQLEKMGLIYKAGEDYYIGKEKAPKKEFEEVKADSKVLNTEEVKRVSKSTNTEEIFKDLEYNITQLLENDFSEEHLIEIINKQESLLKIFEKNTATLLQRGIEKEDLVDLVKTINSRK